MDCRHEPLTRHAGTRDRHLFLGRQATLRYVAPLLRTHRDIHSTVTHLPKERAYDQTHDLLRKARANREERNENRMEFNVPSCGLVSHQREGE